MASKKTNIAVDEQSIDRSANVTSVQTFASPVPPSMGNPLDNAGDIQTPIASGGVTDDRQPEFNGQGTPGSIIVIKDNGTVIGQTDVAANGTWTFTPSTDLLEGLHAITVVARNAAGEESQPSAPFHFEIDVTPPDASKLFITGVMDDVGSVTGNVMPGATTDDTRPLLSGASSGVPGHTVTVMVKDATGMRELGHALVGENGNWTFQVDTPLAAGPNTFSLVARDTAGNETMPTGRYKITVDTDTPSAPVIESVQDDVGTVQMLQKGDVTDDARPTFSGSAQANHTVKLYDGSTLLGQVVADANGKWEFTPTVELADGAHDITATATSPLGQTSGASGAWNFTVDTVPPAAPTLVSVYDDVGATGNVANGGATDDAQPDFKGKAEANSTVVIKDGGVEIGRVQANASGDWTFTPTTALSDGAHSITVTATDKAGNTSAPSAAFGFTVDAAPLGAPTIETVVDNVGSITGNLANGGFTDDTRLDFKGKAEANSIVKVYDGSKLLGAVVADEDGNWAFTPSTALGEGAHSITVTATNALGSTSAPSAAFGFTVDTVAPTAVPVIVSVTDDVGSVTGKLVNGASTDDTKPLFEGTATANATVLLFDKGVEIARVKANASGKWTYTPDTALSEGAHSVSVAHTDAAGNIGAQSPAFALSVDTVPPVAPTLVSVVDDVGSITGNLTNGGSTDDTQPDFKGKAEANSTVKVYDGSTLLGTAVANASGDWTFTPTTALGNGAHSITVTATDKVGNVSAPSATFGFTVDTVAPTQTATLSGLGKDSGFSDADFLTNDGSAGRLMQGSLSAALGKGETLQVSTDGGKTWTAAFASGTQWSAQDASGHTGNWTVQTRVVDEAGNVGVVKSQAITMDTVAPNAPTSVAVEGSKVIVAFDKANVSVGDRVSLANGDQRLDYILAATDIAAGKVAFNVAAGISSALLSAAVIDKAGNSSKHLSLMEELTTVVENFDGDTIVGFYAVGSKADSGTFLLTRKEIGYCSGASPGSGDGLVNSYWTQNGRTWAIYGTTNASLKGLQANSIEFDWRHSQAVQTIIFYDANGGEIHRGYFGEGSSTYRVLDGRSKFVMPNGLFFSSFDIKTGFIPDMAAMDWIEADNFSLNLISSKPVLGDAPNQQVIEKGADGYYGGAGSNMFSVVDVSYFSGGKAMVSGNGGLDTLKLTGANQTLDLTALAGKLSSIEVIDLTGTGNNTLKLSLADVMENGAVDQFVANGRVQMLVKGNAGDKVTLTDLLSNGVDAGDWVKKANVTVSGVVYEVYQHSGFGAELLVQQGVAVTLQNTAATFSSTALEVDADALAHSGYGTDVLAHATQAFTENDDTLIARLGFADRLAGGAGNDTITNVGTADVAHGGAGDDVIRINSGDFERVDGGLGIDTLVMDGKSMYIDLSTFGMKVQGFEKFDLGAGGNTLALHASDVLAGGVRDMVTADGKVQMLVNGANGDVNLLGGDDGWTQGNSTSVSGVTYSVYTNLAGTAELLVEDKVHVTLL